MKDPALFQRWLDNARDLKAVEMELGGVFTAARSVHGDRPVLAIRGISDVVGFVRDPDWTAYACHAAASFARAFLASGLLNIKLKPKPKPKPKRGYRPRKAALNGPRLYALNDCVKDFDATLPSIHPREKVMIEHLGLDLTQAWQYFEPLLRIHANLTDIDYRVLVLTDETAKIAGADEEVRRWSANVPGSLDRVKKDVNAIIDEFGQAKKIRFEVRKYWAIPYIHGFRIISPRSRCYMAFCRWGGLKYQTYEWGEPQYHKIIGDPPSDIANDMLKIYDGYWNNFWKKHSDPGFVLRT